MPKVVLILFVPSAWSIFVWVLLRSFNFGGHHEKRAVLGGVADANVRSGLG